MRYYEEMDRLEDADENDRGNTYNINIDARSVHYHDHGSSSEQKPKIRGRRKSS